MANQLPLLENLTPKDVRDLLDACINFDAKNILGQEYEEVVSYSIPRLKLAWKTKGDFEKDIKFITGANNIVEANKILEKKYISASKNDEQKTIEATTPDKWAREQQETERIKREGKIKETTVQAKKEVEESIKKKQEIYEKRERVVAELKGKTIYAVPEKQIPEIQLDSREQKFVELAKKDPGLFVKNLSSTITDKNPDIPKPLADIMAVDVTKAFSPNAVKPIPTGVFAALAEAPEKIPGLSDNTKGELAKTAAIMTASWEGWTNLQRDTLNKTIGTNLTNQVLGLPEYTYNLSNTQEEGSYLLNLEPLQEKSFSLQDDGDFSEIMNGGTSGLPNEIVGNKINKFALQKLQSIPQLATSRFVSSDAFQAVAPLIGFVPVNTYVGTNFFGKIVTSFFPNLAPLIEGVAWKMGANVGVVAIPPTMMDAAILDGLITPTWMLNKGAVSLAGQVAQGGVKTLNVALGNAVAKGASWMLGKVGATALSAKVGAMVGTGIVPVIGTVVGAVLGVLLGKIIEKIPWRKVAPWLFGGLAGVGAFVLIGPIAGIAAGVTAFGAASAATGSISLGGIGSTIAGIFTTIGGLLVASFVGPFLITAATLTILTALILFIVNSGAYVTPSAPTTGGGGMDIVCDTQLPGNSSANAAVCIVYYLNQYHLNPLSIGLLNSPSWGSLKTVLPGSSISALSASTIAWDYLQCVGLVSATTEYAYGQAFEQHNACGYIGNAPSGYTYFPGTNGIQSGDFFLMGGSDGCNMSSLGHIGVVVSVDGVLISCADANAVGPGAARAAHGCYALSQISGYLRKQ